MYTNTHDSSTSKAPARVATRIVAALEKDIVQGALRPGERLDEQALAQRFEVSRTPVREALMRTRSHSHPRDIN